MRLVLLAVVERDQMKSKRRKLYTNKMKHTTMKFKTNITVTESFTVIRFPPIWLSILLSQGAW